MKIVKTELRWPEGVREAIIAGAQENRRSMNAEIVMRLEASIAAAKQERAA